MAENRSLVDNTVVVILAAGKGTRMGRDDLVKVCFEIDGVPAICQTIAAFKKNRFSRFLLVVGDKAEQVLQAVNAEHPGVVYVYQQPQLGTGHAGRIAAEALANLGHAGHVLVSMGDKYIEPVAIETLVAGHIKQQPDMALLTLPRPKGSDAPGGRVLLDSSGQAVDIIEQADLAKQAIVDELTEVAARRGSVTGDEIREVVARHLPKPDKQAVAVPELLKLAAGRKSIDRAALARLFDESHYHLEIDGRRYPARQIDRMCTGLNPSLYLFRAEAFYTGMGLLRNDNAQGEYYITDVIRLLASVRDERGEPRYKIRSVPADDRLWVQGFNSPNELLAIADYVRRKKLARAKTATATTGRPRLRPNQYATVRQWLAKIEEGRPSLRRWLSGIYGPHDALHAAKVKDLAAALTCFGKRFGFDEKVCIVRAPGRINLMGRHVDHRGGSTNFLAIDRETIAVASLRDDNNVVAVSTRPRQFKPVGFNVSELIGRFAWSDWVNFVNSDWVRNLLYSTAGDWGNYIKAAMLRLQHQYQDVQIRGLNLAVAGNVPMAAGLSSSSSLVVATLQAAIALNNFELTSQQFVDLCGEGEWFVGSRGGAADHAAIYLGQRGKIAHVAYLPFRVERILDAPADYQVVIANSHIKAAKSAGARHTFNEKVASYNLGLALLRQRVPELAASLVHVRDIDPERLGCSTSDIYRMLLKVPQFVTRAEFRSMLAGDQHAELLEVNFATHAEPERYNPRGILLYGAAEIMRSRICGDLLQQGRIEEFGRLMRVSHDGDRVSRRNAEGKYEPLDEPTTDDYLNRLVNDLASEDPARVLGAQLYMQPGAYGCSTPEIDEMVDVASEVPGVVGAQLAGAGLGGCIMILARRDCVDAVRKALVARYYRPRNLEPAILPCIATDGAGLAEF